MQARFKKDPERRAYLCVIVERTWGILAHFTFPKVALIEILEDSNEAGPMKLSRERSNVFLLLLSNPCWEAHVVRNLLYV